jgi:hypothetical protein
MPSWDFLQTFRVVRPTICYTWDSFRRIKAHADKAADEILEQYRRIRGEWMAELAEFGGDPSSVDAASFRPLRLSREEDWSDWLGWLLETSASGSLATELFGAGAGRTVMVDKPPKCRREVAVENRRADLLIMWANALAIHLEVKVGDQNFDKTFETSAKLRAANHAGEWSNFILLPDEDLDAWDEVDGRLGAAEDVSPIAWSDVSVALRRALREKRESITWKALAWVFCGAIEQKIIRLRNPEPLQAAARLQMATRWIETFTNPTRRIP